MQDVPANAPLCAPADANTRKPRIVMPPHACDTHAHVCGPFAKYAYAAERLYTPPDDTWPMYRRMLDTIGVDRAVLTQPSVYGADNTALVDALATGGSSVRGVAVVSRGSTTPPCTRSTRPACAGFGSTSWTGGRTGMS